MSASTSAGAKARGAGKKTAARAPPMTGGGAGRRRRPPWSPPPPGADSAPRGPPPGNALQPQLGERDEKAAAKVVHNWHAESLGEWHEVPYRRIGDEALDRKIAPMHLEDGARARARRSLVVGKVRAIGGADLAEDCSALRDDLVDAKAAADLDELSS